MTIICPPTFYVIPLMLHHYPLIRHHFIIRDNQQNHIQKYCYSCSTPYHRIQPMPLYLTLLHLVPPAPKLLTLGSCTWSCLTQSCCKQRYSTQIHHTQILWTQHHCTGTCRTQSHFQRRNRQMWREGSGIRKKWYQQKNKQENIQSKVLTKIYTQHFQCSPGGGNRQKEVVSIKIF